MATVQRLEVTHEQTSTLFWINVAVGAILATLCAALAPLLVTFYHEPRLYWVAVVSGATFMFNGLSAQHGALLSRGMRFVTQAKIGVLSLAARLGDGHCHGVARLPLLVSGGHGAGQFHRQRCRYYGWLFRGSQGLRGADRACGRCSILAEWPPVTASLYSWRGTRRNSSSVAFGERTRSGCTGGRIQLVTLPVQQLNDSVGSVAFPALSGFSMMPSAWPGLSFSGYSLLISLTIPITITCALFAEEIVRIVLGPKWMAAAPIFRLLAPVALVFAVANPLSWLVMSTGRIGRALSISAATTPLVIVGIVLGLSHGPKGVALGTRRR